MSFGLHLIPFIVLTLQARGEAPSSGSPLLMVAGDPAYEIECDVEIEPGARAGLILFYDRQLYCGLGFDETRFVTHQYGLERGGGKCWVKF